MHYFVTGATGFIGRRLVKALLARRGTTVSFLVRAGSEGKVGDLLAFWGTTKARAIPVTGDLTAKKLGVSADALKAMKGNIDAVFHLAAVYDLSADEESQVRVNIEGTRNLVEFAKAVDAKHLHHVSSIAAAGLYEGVFREDMFDEAENLEHPYFSTKHESEKIVRTESKVPWTVYRPAFVVGDSSTGEMDKIDGPYYFFKLIQRMRQFLPPWLPSVGLEGGRINIVPVDFVVACIDHISHLHNRNAIAGKAFHLVDPKGYRVGDVLDIFSRAAHAPKMNLFVNAALLGFIPKSVKKGMMALAPVRRIRRAVMKDLGLPEDIFTFLNWPTRYDRRALDAVLEGSGIECPDLHDYAWRLWDYWERHLDPALFIDRSLRGQVAGKVVLVTGGSSGIGLATAHKFAEAGATTIICGRDPDKLDEACAEAKAKGHAFIAYPVDLAEMADVDRFVALLLEKHGGVDFLVNNAGRSIRRAIESSYDRFHDYERTMQLNYFGCLRITMGLLPAMVARKKGHVVNISSIGVLTNAPRFSAYVASKAALDAWTRCASSEFADQGITFTTINMPLVRTPMIAPTKIYNNVPTLSPEEAADMVAQACIDKPVRIATRLGMFGELLHATVPRVAQIVMNTSFRMFPDSSAAKGDKAGAAKPQLSAEAVAMQQLMRGIHF
ncbi:MAG: SDR family oxidoreductase [Rubrivivax sp.]|nr:SDR family oxidoreductase [Rubrivivax sp.]